jgi:C2 domain
VPYEGPLARKGHSVAAEANTATATALPAGSPATSTSAAQPQQQRGLHKQRGATYFCEKTLNPTWVNQRLVFTVPSDAARSQRGFSIRVLILSRGMFRLNDFLGQASVPLSLLADQEERVGWFPLNRRSSRFMHLATGDKVSGSVQLRLRWVHSTGAFLGQCSVCVCAYNCCLLCCQRSVSVNSRLYVRVLHSTHYTYVFAHTNTYVYCNLLLPDVCAGHRVRSLRDLGEQLSSRLQRADKLLEHLRREQARTGKQKRIGMQVCMHCYHCYHCYHDSVHQVRGERTLGICMLYVVLANYTDCTLYCSHCQYAILTHA